MSSLKCIKRSALTALAKADAYRVLRSSTIDRIQLDNFTSSPSNPDAYYGRACRSFHRELPETLKNHRLYFTKDGRGFGEDAFHVIWWRLFKRFRPSSFLEIGVYRGQVISLISLLAKQEHRPCRVVGISPFSSEGDTVSAYRGDLNYLEDSLVHFRYHDLPEPELINARSTDRDALSMIHSTQWDMIYIDGNHDYEVAASDWVVCSKAVKPGGCIIMDDSGLDTACKPPLSRWEAIPGHPGPSRAIPGHPGPSRALTGCCRD